MNELGYDINIKEFRDSKPIRIMKDGKLVTLPAYYIHDYYGKNKYPDSEVDEDIKKLRKAIYEFKRGDSERRSSHFAKTVAAAIKAKGINLENTILLVIPASDPVENEKRFSKFSEALSNELGIENGYKAIQAAKHEATKGHAGGNKTESFTFNSTIFKGKNVLLFDDIRTSGTSLNQTCQKLMDSGANTVTGIIFAQTHS